MRHLRLAVLALSFAGTTGLAAYAASAAAQSLDPSRNRQTNGGRPRQPPKPAAAPAAAPTDASPATTTPAPDTQKTLDSIAAVVNGDIITRLELNEKVETAVRAMRRQGVALPPSNVIQRQVLERMIIDRAQLQLAVENGVRVDDTALDRAVQRVAEQNQMSVQQFRDRLEQDGQSFAAFRDDLRQQIMIERTRSREVDDKISVGEGEIDAYIAAQNGVSPDAQPEVDLAQILVRVPENATPEVVEKQKAKADDVYRQVKAGGDFGKLAATYSDAPEALQGGDLGFRSVDRLPQLFVDAIGPLASGDVAEPIRSPIGFHVLKVVAKRTPGAKTAVAPTVPAVEQTHARHILIKVNEVVSADQAKARLEEIRQRIVNKTASFEDMARAYSNDASASRGGDLGTLYPGDTVPDFEKAMNALAPGEVSEPVKSPFGYHLIQVIERKKQDVAQDRVRLLARQAIRERKLDEAADSWAHEQRDRAYVEIRLDDR